MPHKFAEAANAHLVDTCKKEHF